MAAPRFPPVQTVVLQVTLDRQDASSPGQSRVVASHISALACHGFVGL